MIAAVKMVLMKTVLILLVDICGVDPVSYICGDE